MVKFFNKLIKFFLYFVLILSIMTAAILTFVNPNDYRSEINKISENFTGRPIQVKGNIQWSLTPKLALYIQDIFVGNAEGFTGDFLQAKEAHIKIDLLDLFRKKLSIYGIELQGVKVNITTKHNGSNNTEDLENWFAKNINYKTQLKIKDIVFKNVNLYYENKQTNQSWELINATAKIHDLDTGNDYFPKVKLRGIISSGNYPAIKNIEFSTKINLMPSTKELDLQPLILKTESTTINAPTRIIQSENGPVIESIIKANDLRLNLSGYELHNVQANANLLYKPGKKFLKLSAINLEKDESAVTGSLSINKNKIKPTIRFNLNSKDIDLSLFDTSKLANNSELKMLINNYNISGNLYNSNLQIAPANAISTLEFNLKVEDGLATLDPIYMLYKDGIHNARATISFKKKTPFFKVENFGQKIDLKKLFQGSSLENKVSGLASFQMELNSSGSDFSQFKNNATGKMVLDVRNGEIYGADLNYQLKEAEKNINTISSAFNLAAGLDITSLMRQRPLNIENNNSQKTSFNKFKILLNLNNGYSKDSRIQLIHPAYEVLGKGAVNLRNDSLDIKARASLKKTTHRDNRNIAKYLTRISLPISITGTLTNPKVSPDIEGYVFEILKRVQIDNMQQNGNKIDIPDNPIELFQQIIETQKRK